MSASNSSVVIHDYSATAKIIVHENGTCTVQTIDATPSRPPWTTWSGVLECHKDSLEAKKLIKVGPALKRGDDWVRGIWMAPAEWSV